MRLVFSGCTRRLKTHEAAADNVDEAASLAEEDDLKWEREAKRQDLAKLWTQERAAGVANIGESCGLFHD